MSEFPRSRLRRLRKTPELRRLIDMPFPEASRFIWPLFVRPGENRKDEIGAMPGQFRYSVDRLSEAVETAEAERLGGLLLFGVAAEEDKGATGQDASNPEGLVQQAVGKIKELAPSLPVVTDVCLCAYTDHGHCGPLDEKGHVDNDAAIARLGEVAVSHARAGADLVAPSAMMDGQVAAIRQALDAEGFSETPIMSYSTKFASAMYGPFREAEDSSPGSGDRKGYQASYRDLRSALRESDADVAEGADILMVKPALFYLDIIRAVRERSDLPLACYNVSGEYAMLLAAADAGVGELKPLVQESVIAMSRAGADLFLSYWSPRYTELFGEG